MHAGAMRSVGLRVRVARGDRVRELPGGQYEVDGVAGVVGVLEYGAGELGPGAPARAEYVPPEVLFDPASLETLQGAPVIVSNGHEPVGVGQPGNRLVAGSVSAVEPRHESGELGVRVRYWSPEGVEAAKAGQSQLSLYYDADYQAGAGVAPDGTRYDGRQTSRRYNHLAQVDQARAGRRASLRFDGGPRPMFKIQHDGQTHEVPEYIVGACRHHAIEDGDGSTRGDLETATITITMDGEDDTTLMLPKGMIDRWLAELGAMDQPPEAPEIMEEEIEVGDMAGEEKPAEDMPRGDAIQEAIATALARRDAIAAERRDAERVCRALLPASYDYDDAADVHAVRADAVASADERSAAKARDLADKARKGDQRAAGRLEGLVDAIVSTPRGDAEPAGTITTKSGGAGNPTDFAFAAWRIAE